MCFTFDRRHHSKQRDLVTRCLKLDLIQQEKTLYNCTVLIEFILLLLVLGMVNEFKLKIHHTEQFKSKLNMITLVGGYWKSSSPSAVHLAFAFRIEQTIIP